MIGTSYEQGEKVLLIYSGGMDSAPLLFKMLHEGYQVDAVTFDYGQRHKKEIEYAKKMIDHLKTKNIHVRHDIVDTTSMFSHINSSSLTNLEIAVPNCHYTEDVAKITVVPNRNQILLSVAVGIAAARGLPSMYYAAHGGDWAIYPDCRPEFLESLKETTRLSTLWHPVDIVAPFMPITKADIVKLGSALNLPYQLTWSCYNGLDKPCGTCPTCIERIEAFALNGLKDPVTYQKL